MMSAHRKLYAEMAGGVTVTQGCSARHDLRRPKGLIGSGIRAEKAVRQALIGDGPDLDTVLQ
jgi:hypothetical protein